MINTSHSVLYCALVVALGGFIFGLDAALISGTVKFVTNEFNLTDLQIGTVVSAPGFGVIFALMITGYVCDKIGRKHTLVIISFIYIISAVMSVLANSFESLVIARFIGGLAFTSLSVAAMYIGEISPSHLRGKLVSIIQINIVVGLSIAYFANYAILALSESEHHFVITLGLDIHTWRWMLGIEILPAIIWFCLLLNIPQSPRWLIMKHKEEKAKQIINQFNNTDHCDEEITQIKLSLKSHHPKHSFWYLFKSLFDTKVRAAMSIALTIAVVQQITGINAIMFYAPTVFEQLGIGTDAAFFQAIIVGLVSIVFTVVAILLIDRLGRRPLVIWGLAIATISLFACFWGFNQATYLLDEAKVTGLMNQYALVDISSLINVVYQSDVEFKNALIEVMGSTNAKLYESQILQSAANINVNLILAGIIGFIAAFHFSIGPIMWVLFSEIFPTHIRGVAIPVFAFITSFVSYLVQQFFPWLLSVFGADEIFLFYAICGAIGFVLLFKIMPETKNKTIEEIETLLTHASKDMNKRNEDIETVPLAEREA
ncbi:sugar porter family MFS transporter [Shewanella sp. 1_MG-2023]|uniref:sugar porter family MFS transporter n=1 Tax=unclassified Shewanella TaxID=196818 RepID=UPI0026E161C1|nr:MULTISPECIES: sugar porter family MFS transporter [unclassified Shewanella]MDO6612292.1 sugar porter family MFS transporter [Shewanella sp. 7_MG-2023]MDO6772146.1 sugar porter family MFS transporter [Shewanella sp. 2_MG-2023]MDO6794052.1 sugar porter family MFS transporter [Shewanella sp. 1_MG-2023]